MEQELKNYMEVCVDSSIEAVLKDLNCCACVNCIYDIKAIALNSLPPKYVVTRKGQLYTKIYSLQQQFDVDIITAITKAAVIVSGNPRHGENGN